MAIAELTSMKETLLLQKIPNSPFTFLMLPLNHKHPHRAFEAEPSHFLPQVRLATQYRHPIFDWEFLRIYQIIWIFFKT